MKAAFHIAFYYDATRVGYLNDVIEGLNSIKGANKIFIYSNKNIRHLIKNDLGNITCLRFFYNLKILDPVYKKFGRYPYKHWLKKLGLTFFIHPFFLTWENRKVIPEIADDFDVQAYLEDDVRFSDTQFKYWLNNIDICLRHNYNLGFLRYEVNRESGGTFLTDLTAPLHNIIYLEGKPFLVNDNNPYCAFWIMNKPELKEFMKSPEWRFEVEGYDERAISAVGWHGLNMHRYLNTIIPLIQTENNNYRVTDECLVHHLPDNYINHPDFCKIRYPFTVQSAF
jgi:hypothetical protein